MAIKILIIDRIIRFGNYKFSHFLKLLKRPIYFLRELTEDFNTHVYGTFFKKVEELSRFACLYA